MAKRLKAGEDPDAMSGSLTDKKKIIAEVAREVIALEEQRKGIGTQITEARGRLKSAGILQADFNAALRLFKLEGDERGQSIDGMAICMEALAIGWQGDLFGKPPTTEAGDGKAAKPPVKTEVKAPKAGRAKGAKANGDGKAAKPGDYKAQRAEAERAGRAAARAGETIDACPYEEEHLRVAWVTGHDAERDVMAEEEKGGGKGGKAPLAEQPHAGTAD